MKTLGPETDDLLGGDREESTRAMFLAGVAWLDAHPGCVPSFQLMPDKRLVPLVPSAEELLAAILRAAPGGGTAAVDEAMVQTAVNHVSFVRIWGWESYLRKMRRCDCADCSNYLAGTKRIGP